MHLMHSLKRLNLFGLHLFVSVFILTSLIHADVKLALPNNVIDTQLSSGTITFIQAKIVNNGNCSVSCMYSRVSFPGDDYSERISGEIPAGESRPISLNIMVPTCNSQASQDCTVPVVLKCKEIAFNQTECNRDYSDKQVLRFINIVAGSEPMPPGSNQISSSQGKQQDVYQMPSQNPFVPFQLIPESKEISGLSTGEKSSNMFTLVNRANCPLRCTYKVQGGNYAEETITESLMPGSEIKFNVVFFVPEFCKDRCSILTHVTCQQKQDPNYPACMQATFETDVSFDLADVSAPEMKTVAYIILGIIALAVLFALYIAFKFVSSKLRETPRPESEEGKRKLSAILFTDVKGFSREVGKDEEAALKKVWRYEKVMKQIIKEHDGRVVKTIGDAIMGDFDSAVQAVRAAIEIQDLLAKEDIKIRIGIHIGDVIHKGGDIFGEGVNIANRLESICEPGEIYISEDVYNQVRGKLKIEFEPLGRKPLKNIEIPPKVFKIKR